MGDYNGWKNWDTWEAYNALTATDWSVYEAACSLVSGTSGLSTSEGVKQFRMAAAEWISELAPEVNLSMIDWKELFEAIA